MAKGRQSPARPPISEKRKKSAAVIQLDDAATSILRYLTVLYARCSLVTLNLKHSRAGGLRNCRLGSGAPFFLAHRKRNEPPAFASGSFFLFRGKEGPRVAPENSAIAGSNQAHNATLRALVPA